MAQSRHGNKHKKRANKYKNELLAEKKRKKDEYVRNYMEKIKEMQAAQEQEMKRQTNGHIVDGAEAGVDIDMGDDLDLDINLDDLDNMDGIQDAEIVEDEIQDAEIIEDEPSCPTEPEA
jgi:hypothetical protein